MNYSLLLQKSLEVMTSSAQGENLSKINEIIDFIGNIKPDSPFYPTQINQFEVSNIELFGLRGTLSAHFIRNVNGEIQELSATFRSTESINRDIKNDVFQFFARECSRDSICYLKPEKTLTLGYLTHYTSRRANRDYELVSKFVAQAKRGATLQDLQFITEVIQPETSDASVAE